MKLFYNKTSKDPIYYAQVGIRNGKKVTTKNVKRFGKHSELLKITDDPLSYVKEEIRKMNEEYRVGKVEYTFSTNYNERVEQTLSLIHISIRALLFQPWPAGFTSICCANISCRYRQSYIKPRRSTAAATGVICGLSLIHI